MLDHAYTLAAVEQIAAGFFILDQDTRILYCNRFIVEHSGRPASWSVCASTRPSRKSIPPRGVPCWKRSGIPAPPCKPCGTTSPI